VTHRARTSCASAQDDLACHFASNAESSAIEEAIMMQLITADQYGNFIGEIAEMHRLRCRVFRERLDWEVQVSGDMEIDEFDALYPTYLLQQGTTVVSRAVSACYHPPALQCYATPSLCY